MKMKALKKLLRITGIGAALLLLLGVGNVGWGQQLRVSNSYLFNPYLINPGALGGTRATNIFLSHQQRRTVEANWRSISQFLNFRSQPLGRNQNFSWGANIVNDIEWTEFRLGINIAVAVAPINTRSQRLSLGIMLGMINWGSRYDKVRVYDRTDALIADRGNFAEVDAGFGGEYKYWNDFMRFDVSAWAQQLPKNMISKTLPGVYIYPHLFGAAGILFAPVHNLYIGPRAFYRNIFMADTLKIGGSSVDIGLKAELDRQNLWFGGAYRVNKGALTMGFGMRIFSTDTVGAPDLFGYFVDMNASLAFPMGPGAIFGPTVELGVNVAMGRNHRHSFRRDTIRPSTGNFWEDDGHLNDHLVERLKPTAPSGLKGSTQTSQKSVVLTYAFDDNSYQYVGSAPEKANDTLLAKLGDEWLGVDAILENMVNEVIKEALTPDTLGISNPYVLEPLEGLVYVELSSDLLVDEQKADELAKGMMYEGELGTNNRYEDSLYLKVVYNDADTIVGIGKDRQITNLELACLKLHAMRKKLEYELNQRYGENWAVYWEGEELSVEKTQGRKVVYIKKPRITPNHPHQDAFQVNVIKLRFTRGAGASDQVASLGDEKGSNKHVNRRKRDRERRQIRDKVY
jgi:hypothetical protein